MLGATSATKRRSRRPPARCIRSWSRSRESSCSRRRRSQATRAPYNSRSSSSSDEAARRVACISGGSLGASLFCLGRVTIHPPSFPDAGDQLRLPFLQLGNLDLQPLQFAIDARQFRFRLPILQMAVPVLLNDQRFHFTPKKPQPRVPVHRGNPVLQRASLRRSVDLFLRQPKLLPRRLVAEGRSLARPF